MHFCAVMRILSILIMSFSVIMLPAIGVALIYQESEGILFLQSFAISISIGALFWIFFQRSSNQFRSRDGFLIVMLFWIILGLLGSLPFLLDTNLKLTVTQSIFESFSYLTTSGATVLTGIDHLPKSILFYRQFLQWIGGMGIVVLALSILPSIGGSKLLRVETPSPFKDQKTHSKISEVAKSLWQVYTFLTIVFACAYYFAGMNLFDAIMHSFSTVSLGGASTHDANIGYFKSDLITILTALFSLISALNFTVHVTYWTVLKSPKLRATSGFIDLYWHNYEFKAFLFLQLCLFVICSVVLLFYHYFSDLGTTLVQAFFQSVAVSTTAGFFTSDFSVWPSFLPLLLLLASFVGGCSGSTSGGLKVVRALLIFVQMKTEISRAVHPHSVQVTKIGKNVLPEQIKEGIWAYLVAYIMVMIIAWLLTMAMGLSTMDAFNVVSASLNNFGLGFDYSTLPEPGYWLMMILMVAGRLEVFILFMILSPIFWKN